MGCPLFFILTFRRGCGMIGKGRLLRNQVWIMTYKEVKGYMDQIQKRGSVFGLASIKELLRRLDNPQNKLKVIHVAGTNGKGSICTFLEQLYRAEGKQVGSYISPTLHCYLERFQINGRYMEEEVFTALFAKVLPIMKDMEKDGKELPTAFEIETAVAFLYFLQKQVDVVILETGMGGREDATNVVDKPQCTVFSSIGMDHMQFLGDTVRQIAYEKAGIIKAGCPVVSYPNSPEVLEVLQEQFGLHNAEWECHSEFRVVQRSDVQILAETLEQSTFLYKGEEYSISLAGEYQIYNAATAIETKLLLDGHLEKEGLMNAQWEGRFEKVCDHPIIIRDGAHNVDGVNALKENIQKHFTKQRLIFIIGVLKDKEYDKMMAVLCPLAAKVYTITPENARGLSGEVLRASILPYCEDVMACDSVGQALHAARQDYQHYKELGEASAIIAWGSLSYIGQIRG